MALYSLVVEHKGKSYTTQVSASSGALAIREYFSRVYGLSGLPFFGETAPSLNADNIIYVTPMEGLVNSWAACAGRDGSYISLVCTRTVSRQEQ
jgi:hypothetical protein